MNLSDSKPLWVKFGKVKKISFIGRDYIAIGSGCYMHFINVSTKESILYHADRRAVGEGVSFFAGHKTLPVVAFSEKCRYPKIFVMTIPNYTMIGILDKNSQEDYLNLAFSEGEYLLSLSSIPAFDIIIWNWRTGQRITSIKSDIFGEFQIMRCNLSTPVFFAQVLTGSKKVNLWEISVCGRTCLVTPQRLAVPECGLFSDALWTSEGALFVLDLLGHAYCMDTNYSLVRAIQWEGEGKTVTSFTWYKGGMVIAGPDGVVKHFKKTGAWVCDWSVKPDVPIKRIISNNRDSLIGVTVDADILSYDHAECTWRFVTQSQSKFNDMCLIYPLGDYFVTLQHNREVISWDVATGEMKCFKQLRGIALAMTANPEYPYIGVAYSHGVLELLSVYEPHKITTMTSFNLSKGPLNHVYFTDIGKLIVTANLDVGEFFIIEGIPGSHMKIVSTFKAHQQICDYILIAARTCMRLFAIPVTSDRYLAGNKILRFCIIRGQTDVETKEYSFETSWQMYSRIYTFTKLNRDRIFHVMPLTTKCIHELTIKRGDPIAKVTNLIHTGHQMKKIVLHVDAYHATTYAYDGLVIIREADFKKEVAMIMPHYRYFGGVEKAYVDPLERYVVSLGRENTLVCCALSDTIINTKRREYLKNVFGSDRFTLMFRSTTIGFCPKGIYEGLTWFEFQTVEREKAEREASEKKRKLILEEFQVVRAELQSLLTQNQRGPENELLAIQEFNLDEELRKLKTVKSGENCRSTRIYLEALIVAQNKVTTWLKTTFWDKMKIQGTVINAIYDNFNVTNYTLLPREEKLYTALQSVSIYRMLESQMGSTDIFEPWEPITESDMKVKLASKPTIAEFEKVTNLLDVLEEEELVEEDKQMETETDTSFKGSITHHFIELTEGHYPQQQICTFLQIEFDTLFNMIEIYRLKEHFNRLFEDVMSVKNKEMTLLWERNARLRHIISELNFFLPTEEKLRIIIDNATWSQLERPETLLKVENNEVGVEPYISPSEQAKLDAIAAEEERIRLLLLADDFRERALMTMMNGVLEIRWEDEIKKDVPKPKCLLEKDPEEFDQDEIRAAWQYEEDVKFLNSERERYKKILHSEYAKLSNVVRDAIKKFNKRLSDTFNTKLLVEYGIQQDSLKMHRQRLRNLERVKLNKREKEILEAIHKNQHKMEEINHLLATLHECLSELKDKMENLLAKEKVLEKSYKKDFCDASPVVQDQCSKLYKRRPKVNLRNIVSVTLTLEIAKCMLSQERTVLLTPECLDYLKSLDNLDLYVNVPPAVDETFYALVCKHRRFKIENEIRVRAVQLEISEGEHTISLFQKDLQNRKDRGQQLVVDLEQVRNKRLQDFNDMELQLVMREGLVEIPRSGKLRDFSDAILVSRQDVEKINKLILRAGNRKIKAIKETMAFRRGILTMEWEHCKLRMRIEDLKQYKEDILSLKVTKEIQSYLKAKAKGYAVEKNTFEEEMAEIRQQYMKKINELKGMVGDVTKKIKYLESKNKNALGQNEKLSLEIEKLNVDVCALQLERDHELEEKEKNLIKNRMATLLKRTKFIKTIQKNHSDILMLQTELEILRLKTYPTLSYTIFN